MSDKAAAATKREAVRRWRSYWNLLTWMRSHQITVRRHQRLRSFWNAHGPEFRRISKLNALKASGLRKLTKAERAALDL